MDEHKLLPKNFKLVCVGRREFSAKSYLKFILKKSRVVNKLSAKKQAAFLKHIIYYREDFDNVEHFKELSRVLADIEKPKHVCFNRLFYFATSPQQFAALAQILKSSGLLNTCDFHGRKARILVEKPFWF